MTKSLLLAALLMLALVGFGPGTAQAQPVLNHCNLSWSASNLYGVQGYNVYFSADPGQPGVKVGSVAGASTVAWSCPSPQSLGDSLKYATVAAYYSDGTESARSNEVAFLLDTTPPSTPSGVTIAISDITGTVNWMGSSDSKRFDLYLTQAAGALGNLLVSSATTSATFSTGGLPYGTHYVTVIATDAAGNVSAPSAQGSFTLSP